MGIGQDPREDSKFYAFSILNQCEVFLFCSKIYIVCFQIVLHIIRTYIENKKPSKSVINAKVNGLMSQNVTKIKSPLPTVTHPNDIFFHLHFVTTLWLHYETWF